MISELNIDDLMISEFIINDLINYCWIQLVINEFTCM